MKKAILIVCFISFCFSVWAQHQERHLFLYNTVFGGLTGGIGAVINKPKKENWKQSFVRGFWQGSIGGSLIFAGKKTLSQVYKRENIAYGWPAKVLHSAGSSIVYNAALHEPFLANWNIEYGPVRLDITTSGSQKLQVRFLPWTIYSVISSAKNSVFDLSRSLISGDLVFRYKKDIIRTNRGDFLGINYGRSFIYTNLQDKYFIMAHEMVHSFQFREYQVFNTWLRPLISKVKTSKTKSFFEKHVYPDIPYQWLFYSLEGFHNYHHYFRNFFELEAQRFATGKYVQVP